MFILVSNTVSDDSSGFSRSATRTMQASPQGARAVGSVGARGLTITHHSLCMVYPFGADYLHVGRVVATPAAILSADTDPSEKALPACKMKPQTLLRVLIAATQYLVTH